MGSSLRICTIEFRMDLEAIQSALRDAQLDGWLFYDHHHRDPIAYRILGLPADSHVTRRWYYFIPALGDPKKLVHRIESGRLDTLPGTKQGYSSWQELESQTRRHALGRNHTCHAILAAKRHHVRLDGRRRNRRSPARAWQNHRLFRRSSQPVRSHPYRRPDRDPLRRAVKARPGPQSRVETHGRTRPSRWN